MSTPLFSSISPASPQIRLTELSFSDFQESLRSLFPRNQTVIENSATRSPLLHFCAWGRRGSQLTGWAVNIEGKDAGCKKGIDVCFCQFQQRRAASGSECDVSNRLRKNRQVAKATETTTPEPPFASETNGIGSRRSWLWLALALAMPSHSLYVKQQNYLASCIYNLVNVRFKIPR